jgi:hypothetical protein
MSTLTRRTAWTLLVLSLVLIAICACNSGSNSTSTTTPAPILADPDSDMMALFHSITVEEQQCAVLALGQARLEEILNQADASNEEDLVFQQCLSQETLARIVVGAFISEVGNLSDSTMDCIWATLEDIDLMSLVQENGDASGAFLGFMRMPLCLSNEEVAQVEAMELAGPDYEGSKFTPEQLTCLQDAVGDEALTQMFSQDGAPSLDIIFAMIECGMELAGPDYEGSKFTPEQLTCLQDAVGDEALTQMFSQDGAPSLDIIFAILECGFAMPDEPDSTDSTLDGVEGLMFTPEQLACVQDALGDDAVAELRNGERLPAFEEIVALANCDLDFLGMTAGN